MLVDDFRFVLCVGMMCVYSLCGFCFVLVFELLENCWDKTRVFVNSEWEIDNVGVEDEFVDLLVWEFVRACWNWVWLGSFWGEFEPRLIVVLKRHNFWNGIDWCDLLVARLVFMLGLLESSYGCVRPEQLVYHCLVFLCKIWLFSLAEVERVRVCKISFKTWFFYFSSFYTSFLRILCAWTSL